MTNILVAANNQKVRAISASQENTQNVYTIANNLLIPSGTVGNARTALLSDKYSSSLRAKLLGERKHRKLSKSNTWSKFRRTKPISSTHQKTYKDKKKLLNSWL